MDEKRRDIPFEELLNEGEVPLSDFLPLNDDRDMVTVMAQSPLRQSLYFGRRLRPAHTATDYQPEPEAIKYPDHVVTNPIEVDGSKWKYKTQPTDTQVHLRRVFVLKDQVLQLDLENTLSWLSASEGSLQHEAVKKQLETEVANVNNQAILQLMTDRLDEGDSMLPNRPYKPR